MNNVKDSIKGVDNQCHVGLLFLEQSRAEQSRAMRHIATLHYVALRLVAQRTSTG